MKKTMPLVASIMLILVAGMFAGAGTMAYFSDNGSAGKAKFTAGTIDLTFWGGSWQDTITTTLTFDNMAPGDTETWTIYMHNAGSLPIKKLLVDFNVIKDREGANPSGEPQPGSHPNPSGELDKYLYVGSYRGGWGSTKTFGFGAPHGGDPGDKVRQEAANLDGTACLLALIGLSQIDPDGGLNDVIGMEVTFTFLDTGSDQSEAMGDYVTVEYTFEART